MKIERYNDVNKRTTLANVSIGDVFTFDDHEDCPKLKVSSISYWCFKAVDTFSISTRGREVVTVQADATLTY